MAGGHGTEQLHCACYTTVQLQSCPVAQWDSLTLVLLCKEVALILSGCTTGQYYGALLCNGIVSYCPVGQRDSLGLSRLTRQPQAYLIAQWDCPIV